MKNIADYNFRYTGRMTDAMKSLPVGNGVFGANVWLDGAGVLHLLFSRTDSWSELGRLLKTAHITVEAGFSDSAEFDLDIYRGVLTVSGGKGRYTIFADDVSKGIFLKAELTSPAVPAVRIENYRSKPIRPTDSSNCTADDCSIPESADTVTRTRGGGIAQIHRNGESCYEFMLKKQEMEFWSGKQRDPLLGWTFGTAVYSDGLTPCGDRLTCGEKTRGFTLSVYSDAAFTCSADEIAMRLDGLYAENGGWSEEKLNSTEEAWKSFWSRSYILIGGSETAESVTRALLYQRYMVRCADRGSMPIKFNGSIFVSYETDGVTGNYDSRRWGGPYWIQNTRLIYWYLLMMGDYRSMTPLIDMYLDMMPISEAHVRAHFGHSGIHIYETAAFFGLARDCDYGDHSEGACARYGEMTNRYIRYHFEGMLELSYMMLKYLDRSGDGSRRGRIFDFCLNTLRFFDGHFGTLGGKLLLCPVSALETWQYCADDAPDIAGLKAVCGHIGRTEDAPAELRGFAANLTEKLPDIPSDGEKLLPCAEKIEKVPRNSENPELYPVFPFELYGVGRPDIDLPINAYNARSFRHDGGWSQDPIDAAMLGLVDEAVRHLSRESLMTDKNALFPAMWGPNFDETPDQDHGSVICITAAAMLIQGNTVFPCWPKDWDVEFRLPDDKGRFIAGKQINGKREYTIEG